jgi:hypothetical protein
MGYDISERDYVALMRVLPEAYATRGEHEFLKRTLAIVETLIPADYSERQDARLKSISKIYFVSWMSVTELWQQIS